MTKFWQILAVSGAIVFLIILFYMTKTSTETRDTLIQKSETSLYSDINSATFTTNYGKFTVQLEREKAPLTTENFIKLAKAGFYDGQRFHRVIEDFMIQGGDPLSKDLSKKAYWGTGGPGYKFADEFGEGLSNVTGTISMANSGPDTNGSQFFINVNDNTFLDKKHAVFGEVTDGMDVVMTISKVSKNENDQPLQDVVIQKVEVK
jgi:cyclophilin family peptidyl-prolyl cis-trans isomerase